MPFRSIHPSLAIPKCNILSYNFPADTALSEKSTWIDAAEPTNGLSQAQMLSWVKKFSVGLDKLGVGQQQAVMVFTPNHIFVPVVYLAAAGSKRFFTGANPAYTVDEVAYQMKIVRAAVILVHPLLLDKGLAAAKQVGVPVGRIFQFSETECLTRNGVQDWRALTSLAPVQEAESWQWDSLTGDSSLSTIAAINFSSGTTGLPKGVCITHHNLISNAAQTVVNKFHGVAHSETALGSEKWLATLPLYHAYSQLWTITLACRLQASVYVMSKFVFEDYLRYIEKYRITTLQAVPPMLIMLGKRAETTKYDLTSLRSILCGAAPLSPELQNQVSKRVGAVVLQGWGMTETTCAGIVIPGMLEDESGSVGCLLPNTEAMLVNEKGKEVTTDGEPGELLLRGPQIMLKYWEDEEATKESITTEGWLRTGDIAVVRNGKFWIVDRKKELIKVNGLQVAPAELEAVLLYHEGVLDAAVTGITLHDKESPRAYVVLREGTQATERDVQDFVAAKVAKHKRLSGGVSFVPEIPKLASGKIIRKQLREWSKRDAKEIEDKVRARL